MLFDYRNIKFVIVAYSLLIISFYSTVITSSYAFLDDYSSLSGNLENIPYSFKFDIYSGRPLFAVFRYFESLIVNNISDFWFLRLFSVVSLISLSVLIYIFISKRDIFESDAANFSFPLAIAFIPSLQLFSAWATCYSFTFAVVMCGISYNILFSTKNKNFVFRWVCSFIFISIAFSIYQPSGMSFIFFIILDNCFDRKKINILTLIQSFVMMFLGMVSSLVMTKFIPFILYGSSISRSTMTNDFSGKLNWFYNETLYNTFNTYNLNPNLIFLGIGLVLFLISILFFLKSSSGFIKACLVILLPIASYFPNLYVSESWAAQRSMIAISLCVVSVIIYGLFKLNEMFLKNKSSWIVPLFIILLTGLSTSYNINNYMVINQIQERESIAYAIADKIDRSYNGNLMVDIRERNWGAFSRTVRYDEFGENSIYAPWTVRGILLSIKKDKGYSYNVPEKPSVSDENRCENNCIVIKPSVAMLKATTNY